MNVLFLLMFLSLVNGRVLDRYFHQWQKRIVNGMNARIGGFPWQISMFRNGKHWCGGTLLTFEHVMSAAHCFKDGHKMIPLEEFRVILGQYNMDVQETDRRVRRISSVIVHEEYQLGHRHANDIAIATLATPIEISYRIYPACLPSKEVADGKECFITGWGKTFAWGKPAEILQELKTSVVGVKECQRKNQKGSLKVTTSNLCTGDESDYSSGCRGDSGGPLSCKDITTAEWKVYGVVSWGDVLCNGLEHYTVYAKVTNYLPWIKKLTGVIRTSECFRADP